MTIRYGVRDVPERAVPGAAGVPVVAMVARFEPQKDYACLLRALAGVAGPWRAVLVGDGPTRPAAEALARELGIAERVSFLGSRDDVAGILASAHVFALATRWEGLPITILEAMRAGLPVVASDVGGVSEAVLEGENGFVVPSGDPDRLGNRIDQLCAGAALRNRMGATSRRRFEAEFTLERMLTATAAVYDGILRVSASFGRADGLRPRQSVWSGMARRVEGSGRSRSRWVSTARCSRTRYPERVTNGTVRP